MEFLIITFVCIICIIILTIIFRINIKKVKSMRNIPELDAISDKYPNNIELGKEYLKKLGNENVEIEEDENSDATVYIAVSNKICIGNLKKSYTRIQTVAHECIHSTQNRRVLLFNFIFSNIYLLYFFVILVLALLKKLSEPMTFIAVLTILGSIYLVVRMYLENDAMIKARFLAKEYMEEKGISNKEEIDKIIKQYDIVNDLGIRCVHWQMLVEALIKIAFISLVCFIR